MLLTGLVIVALVSAFVLVTRYREYPKGHRPSLNPWRWLRHTQWPLPERIYRCDETAKAFAEQWDSHPTLTNRQARAIKRTLRKKKNRGR